MKFQQQWMLRHPGGEWFPASVPGNIQSDYAKTHDFGDIHYGMNHLKFLEIEDWEWEYRTELSFERKPDERVWFVTHGIDYFYDIAVNGEILHRHEGMFSFTEIDITDYLHGSDTLSVFVHPHPKVSGVSRDRKEAAASCKPAVSYSWDYHPRVLPSGIWDETYIETRTSATIREVEVQYTLSGDLRHAEVHFAIDCGEVCEIELFDAAGVSVYRGTAYDFTLDDPHLWWCNGQGEAYLYRWVVHSSADVREGTVGFRRIALVMNDGAWSDPSLFPKSRSAAPITVELNGRRIFAKGSNWVLPDMFPGALTPEMIERHVTLAQKAHMNIFRCHGGSGINKDVFYETCDRLGIMVWVEFPLACNNYRGTPEYLRTLTQEATAIIRRLRPHASVCIWCGGNELFNSWSGMTDQSLALRLLNKLCYELSPERPFLMTSPLYGMGHGGYTFWDDAQNCDCFTLFQKNHCTAYSEFGIPATCSVETLRSIIPEEVLFPPKPEENWIAHHAFGAWGEKRWLCPDVISRYFRVNSIEELVYCSQWLQCEGYKAIFEEARRQWPHCSMAINWCFSEPWKTAANNSLISYPCEPKPGYYAVADSLRPILFSARIPKFEWKTGEIFRAELWLLNDSISAVDEEVTAELELNGVIYPMFTWKAHAEAQRNTVGPSVNMKLPNVPSGQLKLRLRAGEFSSEYVLVYTAKEPAQPSRFMNM